MDTMCRLFTTILVVGLLGSAVGCCHHAAGVCDCVGPGDTCCYGHGPGSHIDPYGLMGSGPMMQDGAYEGAPITYGSAPNQIQQGPVVAAPRTAPAQGQWRSSKMVYPSEPALAR